MITYTFVLLFFSYNCLASSVVGLETRAELFDLVQETAKLFFDVLNYNAQHPCAPVTELPPYLLAEYNRLLKRAHAIDVVSGVSSSTLDFLQSVITSRYSSTFIVSPTHYKKVDEHSYDDVETWIVNSTYVGSSTFLNYISGINPVTNNLYISGTWDIVAKKASHSRWVITNFNVDRVNAFGLPPALPVINCPPPPTHVADEDDDDDYKKQDDDDHKEHGDDDDNKKHGDDDDHKKQDDDDHKEHDDDDDNKKYDDDDS